MTLEEKDLLLKGLCSRLPYGVRGFYKTSGIEITSQKLTYDIIGNLEYKNNVEYKPYLFPLSSMTKEQSKIYHELIGGMFGTSALINFEVLEDFFHKNHLDYRGLIPMGLAIDATGLNIY